MLELVVGGDWVEKLSIQHVGGHLQISPWAGIPQKEVVMDSQLEASLLVKRFADFTTVEDLGRLVKGRTGLWCSKLVL